MEPYDFGLTIKKLRKERKLSQKALSEILGVHLSTIQKWESNLVEPPWSKIKQLARLYQCSLDYLAGYTVSKYLGDLNGLQESQQHAIINLINEISDIVDKMKTANKLADD